MITYIHGLADEDMLERLRKRIDALNFDGFLSTSYVAQMIADQKRSPFPNGSLQSVPIKLKPLY